MNNQTERLEKLVELFKKEIDQLIADVSPLFRVGDTKFARPLRQRVALFDELAPKIHMILALLPSLTMLQARFTEGEKSRENVVNSPTYRTMLAT